MKPAGTELYVRYREAGASEAVRTTEQTALPRLPDEDEERRLVHRTARVLSEYDYQQYEISNYARAGCECRHNLTYWRRGDYLGLGLGAASCVGERRWKNTSDLAAYLGETDAYAARIGWTTRCCATGEGIRRRRPRAR